MPNCSERAISTIIVDPDIAVGPCDDVARNIVGIDKEDRIIVDHFVNAAVPGGDVNDAVAICAQTVIVIVPPTVGQFCRLDPFHLKRPYCELVTQMLPWTSASIPSI